MFELNFIEIIRNVLSSRMKVSQSESVKSCLFSVSCIFLHYKICDCICRIYNECNIVRSIKDLN